MVFVPVKLDPVKLIPVVIVGLVANTKLPLPVDVVIADKRFALDGVPRNVATPVPSPLTPEEIGNPVQFVSVPDVGVPNIGVELFVMILPVVFEYVAI